MRHRLADLDVEYYRRMAATVPLAVVLIVALFIIVPGVEVREPEGRTAGFTGPLRVLPEIDITTDDPEESSLTAAPKASPPADFVAVNLDYAVAPRAVPRPEPSPVQEEAKDEEILISELDDLQHAIRTTGHPVLAQTDYELIYMQRPIYPREAVRREIEGLVEIMMLVDTRGRVSRAYVVVPGRLPVLEKAALDAVYRSLFRPFVVEGKVTPFWVRVPIEFRLVD